MTWPSLPQPPPAPGSGPHQVHRQPAAPCGPASGTTAGPVGRHTSADQFPAGLAQPGHLEHAIRELQLTEPALLVRASAIDEAGRDLLAEAIAKAHHQASATSALDPPASVPRRSV